MSGSNLVYNFEDQQLLLREITHRINNELASAINMASLNAARSKNKEVKIVLAAVIDHLCNFARVHRALQIPSRRRSMDASAYIRSLCQSMSKSTLANRGIELIFTERPVRLDSERCWILGMIISEWITNAARHAFGPSGGTIWVELSFTGALIEGRVVDNGMTNGRIQPGQGTKIVRALTKALNGEVTQQFEPRGSISIVTFPIVDPAANSSA